MKEYIVKQGEDGDKQLSELVKTPHYGADEAGRGCLNGPVVVASCKIEADKIPELNDSKQLSEKQRDALFDKIVALAEDYKVVVMSPQDVDRLNVLQASLTGMRNAYLESEKLAELYLVDGNRLPEPIDGCGIYAVIKGDFRVPAISAASILAKVSRDRIMMALHEERPYMGYDKHKGYGTQLHLEMMRKHGLDDSYRMTVGPVKEINAPEQIKEQGSLF